MDQIIEFLPCTITARKELKVRLPSNFIYVLENTNEIMIINNLGSISFYHVL